MKEPKMGELEIDHKGTRQIHRKMAAAKSVKITINIDKENLDIIRTKAAESGVPYQRLVNRLLGKALQSDRGTESRLSQLEAEVTKLKRKVLA